MPLSFTGFSGTAMLVLIGVAIVIQLGRQVFHGHARQHGSQG